MAALGIKATRRMPSKVNRSVVLVLEGIALSYYVFPDLFVGVVGLAMLEYIAEAEALDCNAICVLLDVTLLGLLYLRS